MTVYVVGYTTAYDGGDIQAVYSTRELAEASWEMRNQGKYGSYEITEFELDLDPKADEPDIDRRPVFGPRTFAQHNMNEILGRISTGLWSSSSGPSWAATKPLPMPTGNTIKFFSYSLTNSSSETSKEVTEYL